jgi:hypothetical protein
MAAATLFFSPSTKTVAVGDTFSISVEISSPDQAMNAAAGTVSFPSDKVRVLSLSTNNSIMNLWVQNPSFSNLGTGLSGGSVEFAGVVLNPGFIGNDGTILTIHFQAIAEGNVSLSFSTSSVLANDGAGTGMLTSAGIEDITITPAVAQPRPVTVPASVSSTSPTSSYAAIPPAPPVYTSGTNWFFIWTLIVLFLLVWIEVVAVLVYELVNRARRRKEFRKIEKELESGSSDRAQIEQEIEKLEDEG